MSFKFNKQSPSDFGLTFKNNTFYRESDNTIWKMCYLYDFGWGCENGFCRQPLLNFNELIDLCLNSKDWEDQYGAAAIIISKYIDLLYFYLNDLNIKIKSETIYKLDKFFDFERINKFILPNTSISKDKWELLLSK